MSFPYYWDGFGIVAVLGGSFGSTARQIDIKIDSIPRHLVSVEKLGPTKSPLQ